MSDQKTQNSNSSDLSLMIGVIGLVAFLKFKEFTLDFTPLEIGLFVAFVLVGAFMAGSWYWTHFSKKGKELRAKTEKALIIPLGIRSKTENAVQMGIDEEFRIPIYLPDNIRRRHVHILGATGSGKTESVILNFLKQDVARGYGAIILDAKGDISFIDELKKFTSKEKLRIFDLGDEKSLSYNPVKEGSPLEAAQRLFSSMTWSEEFYKSKALFAIQAVFKHHHYKNGKNPTLAQIKNYFEDHSAFAEIIDIRKNDKRFDEEYLAVAGVRDQLGSMCVGHLSNLLSKENSDIRLDEAATGTVIYFRLQSMLSPQAVKILGRLLINNLNFLAGRVHRGGEQVSEVKLVPTYLDEFASFACDEFADLISKARSAGFALHFSHQSIGDLQEVSRGFLNRITDNSATKIVLRINDPDSAEFFSRSFGTVNIQKTTQRITKSTDDYDREFVGEGTSRDAHQFRSGPDVFKTLPTGVGSVLIAHGEDTKEGGSHVFKIRFPRIN